MSEYPDRINEHDENCHCRMCRHKHKDKARKMEKQSMAEELIASAGSTLSIPVHPEDQYPATCIDIVDLGMQPHSYQGEEKPDRHRIYLRFYCGENFEAENGEIRPLWVDAYFTLTLHENGALRPFLEMWRGKDFTDAELAGFNIAKLLHAPAFLQLKHKVTPTKTYCNVASVMKLPKGLEAPGVPDGYVRVKDREPKEEEAKPKLSEPDDDLPF